MKDHLVIFDTTMRDGEQSPGASMTREEKVRIARQLERMRVNVVEAGFPAASNGEFEAVSAVAKVVKDSTVAGLCRANDRDIMRGVEALKDAKSWRIHTFIATSELHMKEKLRMTASEVLEAAILAVRFARKHCGDVEFSPEDASRSDFDFLCRVIEAVIREGATTINIPDTVGYAVPQQFGEFVGSLRERITNSDKAVWSVHCHNDLGMAVANSLAAVVIGGVRQVECTINGLGERAGNASLEEVVMAVKTRGDFYPVRVDIDTTQIVPTSKLVSGITGFIVQPNKAIVGANAFAHASGIHQDGVIKARQTYEIMRPEDVGWDGKNLVLSKHSGRAAVRKRLEELGIVESGEAFEKYFQAFKDLADKKTEIFDDDLRALWSGEDPSAAEEHWKLEHVSYSFGGRGLAGGRVILTGPSVDFKTASSEGDGPADAVFKSIERLAESGAKLVSYSVNAVTPGTDSQGEVTVRLVQDGHIVNGHGSDTDIIVASAKAYINALNKLHNRTERIDPQV